jgi:hypothetical protein
MVLYMIDSMGLFACLLALNRDGRAMETIGDFAGLSRVRPGMAVALTVLAFSIAGVPPFSGFWAKYLYAFRPAIEAELWGPAVFGLLTGVVAAFYYLRLVKTIWFDPAPGETERPPQDARGIAFASALFRLPGGLPRAGLLEPYARAPRILRPELTRAPRLRRARLDQRRGPPPRGSGETGPLWIAARRQTAGRGRYGRPVGDHGREPRRHPAHPD